MRASHLHKYHESGKSCHPMKTWSRCPNPRLVLLDFSCGVRLTDRCRSPRRWFRSRPDSNAESRWDRSRTLPFQKSGSRLSTGSAESPTAAHEPWRPAQWLSRRGAGRPGPRRRDRAPRALRADKDVRISRTFRPPLLESTTGRQNRRRRDLPSRVEVSSRRKSGTLSPGFVLVRGNLAPPWMPDAARAYSTMRTLEEPECPGSTSGWSARWRS
jgi:hypothetical protein